MDKLWRSWGTASLSQNLFLGWNCLFETMQIVFIPVHIVCIPVHKVDNIPMVFSMLHRLAKSFRSTAHRRITFPWLNFPMYHLSYTPGAPSSKHFRLPPSVPPLVFSWCNRPVAASHCTSRFQRGHAGSHNDLADDFDCFCSGHENFTVPWR